MDEKHVTYSKSLEADDIYNMELGEVNEGLLDARRRRSSAIVPLTPSSSAGVSAWRSLRGPCRILRLCLLGLVTPALLISVPLYMRYHVLNEQQYPVALSDVRLLDSKVSTTWCQRQVVSGNASFNAYLMPETPSYRDGQERVGMTRHLFLSDDMKEYWGFYLLPGSKVHISACSRWPGASLIVIRGYKHLHDCAYIGDDSSEEADELAIIEREKAALNYNANVPKTSQQDESPSDAISTHRTPRLGRPLPIAGKSYDDTVRYEKFSSTPEPVLTVTGTPTTSSMTTKSSAEAFDELHARVAAMGPSGIRALRRLALRLDAEPSGPGSSEESSEVMLLRRLVQQLLQDTDRERRVKNNKPQQQDLAKGEVKQRGTRHLEETEEEVHAADTALRNLLDPEGLSPDGIADHRGHIHENKTNDRSNDEFWSSVSSSEEALRNCEGLILYLPLKSTQSCNHPASASITPTDTFSYVASASGYYFFVFSSENEIQENLISVGFSLERTVYNVSTRMAQCDNATSCAFPLDFFSSEKVVLEVPIAPGKEGPSPGDSPDTVEKHWNEEYLVVSTCEPRTSIYLACVILVPVFIMMVALQKL
ncbi:hypothetical protein B566_EDAN005475 [Ephemera danica]|nr:hypothetical protein B566_EDAN005475 [Ephemera danica]